MKRLKGVHQTSDLTVVESQRTLGMFHLEEQQLFTAVYSAKHVHYLLGVEDKVKESSK